MNTQSTILKNKFDRACSLTTDYTVFEERLPINKLCGLKVYCKISFSRTKITFYIDSDTVYSLDNNGNSDEVRLFTTYLFNGDSPLLLEDFETALKKLNDIMKKIKFNKYSGLYETEKSNEITSDMWRSIIGDGDYIEYDFDKCCVCLEITKSTAKNCCNKSLCYECWDKLPSSNKCSECEEEYGDCEYVGACGTPKCPLCRCSLATGNEFES